MRVMIIPHEPFGPFLARMVPSAQTSTIHLLASILKAAEQADDEEGEADDGGGEGKERRRPNVAENGTRKMLSRPR